MRYTRSHIDGIVAGMSLTENTDAKSTASFDSIDIPLTTTQRLIGPNMSGRRTTRATSRVASSRGSRPVSPSLTDRDAPATPSTTRRGRNLPTGGLPPITSLRTSTAYGSNSVVQPANTRAPTIGGQIGTVLGGLLDPVAEERESNSGRRAGGFTTSNNAGSSSGSRRRRQGTTSVGELSDADVSYELEKDLYGEAGIDSSVVAGVPDQPRSAQKIVESDNAQTRRDLVEEVARTSRVGNNNGRQPLNNLNNRLANTIIRRLNSLPQGFLQWFLFPMLALFFLSAIIRGIWGTSIFGAIGNMVSSSASTTRTYWNPDEVAVLKKQLKIAESDILQLLKHSSRYDKDAASYYKHINRLEDITGRHSKHIDRLEEITGRLTKHTELDHQTLLRIQELIPDFIVCKKDRNGDAIIPDDFWSALVARLRQEDHLFETEINAATSVSTSTTNMSSKQVRQIAAKAVADAEKTWKKFLDQNVQRLRNWDDDDFKKAVWKNVEKYSETHMKVDQTTFAEAIQKNWDETQYDIQSQLGPLSKELESSIRRIKQLEHESLTKDQVRSIAHSVATKLLPHAKLNAQSQGNINKNTRDALLRVNHFSRGTGAVIDPTLTSPNFLFHSMKSNSLYKAYRWVIGYPIRAPNPPAFALEKWEEHGDCWCSPTMNEDGFGPSLSVITSNYIQPDHIIVEHIPETASLEPGSAPKDMELFAYIEDEDVIEALRSSRHGPSVISNRHDRLNGWVSLGSWTYDAASPVDVQSFPLADLKQWGPKANSNKFVVRAKNNWNPEVQYTCLYRVRLTGDVIYNDE